MGLSASDVGGGEALQQPSGGGGNGGGGGGGGGSLGSRRSCQTTDCMQLSLSLSLSLYLYLPSSTAALAEEKEIWESRLKEAEGEGPDGGPDTNEGGGGVDERGGESCIPPPPLLQAAAARGKRGTVGWREYKHTCSYEKSEDVALLPPPFLFPLLSGGVVRATLSIGPLD